MWNAESIHQGVSKSYCTLTYDFGRCSLYMHTLSSLSRRDRVDVNNQDLRSTQSMYQMKILFVAHWSATSMRPTKLTNETSPHSLVAAEPRKRSFLASRSPLWIMSWIN